MSELILHVLDCHLYRYLFVFSDVVMITEQKKAKKADRAYKFIEEGSLLGATVVALPDSLCMFASCSFIKLLPTFVLSSQECDQVNYCWRSEAT